MSSSGSIAHPVLLPEANPAAPVVVVDLVDLVGARIAPPVTNMSTVPRTNLVDRLRSTTAPVIGVVAPTGYGKTTLVARWAELDERPVAWLSLDDGDNDTFVLLAAIAASVDRIQPIEPSVMDALRAPSPAPGVARVPSLAAALDSLVRPILLVIDDVHVLRRRAPKDALRDLAERLPRSVQLVLISRTDLPVRTEALRAHGKLVEIGASDLALDDAEAQLLLRGAGVEVSREDVTHLNKLTEGWPAGLYLAALSFRNRAMSAVAPTRLAADDRYIADYLRSEVLSQLPAKDARFLIRTSILARMSGPLCDATLETTGSAETLTSLSQENLFLAPIDRQGRWFRYHHMFQAMLRSELARSDAEEIGGLHRRAAAWCRENGLLEDAIVHARTAGDGDLFAQLFVLGGLPTYREGRLETVLRWAGWLEEDGLVERHPAVAVLGASMFALTGDAASAERWAGAAERGPLDVPAPDGSASVAPWVLGLQALLCREGPERMLEDGQRCVAGLSPASPLRPMALVTVGVSHLLMGNVDDGDPILAEAAETATHSTATGTATVALAERAFIAIGRDDWLRVRSFADAATEMIRRWKLEGYMTSALAFVAAARVAVHLGAPGRAREDLTRADRLRPLLTHAVPWLSVVTLLEQARVHLALADPSGARTLLREVDEIMRRRPALGILRDEADELRKDIATMPPTRGGFGTLTTAELRLLPLLATHLSFREIGERLFVSPNTIKTQAISIYRKLGTNSRGGAVVSARGLGLLDG